MDKASIKKVFIDEYRKNISRDGSENLLQWLEGTDFFDAPASSRFHGAFEGGLALHSLRVLYEARRLTKAYSEVVNVSPESLVICSLLHDICKVNTYKIEMRNVKENGTWVQKPFYKHNEDFKFGGHGSKSVFLIQKHMQLSNEEAAAVNCHMGSWDTSNSGSISDVYGVNFLAWVLHVADEACTFVLHV